MAKLGKRIKAAREGVDRIKAYGLDEAVKIVKSKSKTKFDETVDVEAAAKTIAGSARSMGIKVVE